MFYYSKNSTKQNNNWLHLLYYLEPLSAVQLFQYLERTGVWSHLDLISNPISAFNNYVLFVKLNPLELCGSLSLPWGLVVTNSWWSFLSPIHSLTPTMCYTCMWYEHRSEHNQHSTCSVAQSRGGDMLKS